MPPVTGSIALTRTAAWAFPDPSADGNVAVSAAVPSLIAVTVKEADVEPAGMTTEAGTVAAAVLEERRVIVVLVSWDGPMMTLGDAEPPSDRAIVDGEIAMVGLLTVAEQLDVSEPREAGIVAVIDAVPDATPVTANVAVVCPVGMLTEEGTVATDGLPDASVTVVADDCAAPMVTVPVPVPPTKTLPDGHARLTVTFGTVMQPSTRERLLGLVSVTLAEEFERFVCDTVGSTVRVIVVPEATPLARVMAAFATFCPGSAAFEVKGIGLVSSS